MRYIELNPVRANMVRSPAHYPWSSYRTNALSKENSLITPHAEYVALGTSSDEHSMAYKDLFKGHVDAEDLRDIRTSLQTGTPLGNSFFKAKIEARLGLKVGHSKRGRPFKIIE